MMNFSILFVSLLVIGSAQADVTRPVWVSSSPSGTPRQLLITSSPSTAEVYLDGSMIGKTPVKVMFDPDWPDFFSVRFPNLKTTLVTPMENFNRAHVHFDKNPVWPEGRVTYSFDDQGISTVDPTPIDNPWAKWDPSPSGLPPNYPPYPIKLVTNPPGAEVDIDGEDTAKTPCFLRLDKNRGHKITIRMRGYQRETTTSTVDNNIKIFTFNLKKSDISEPEGRRFYLIVAKNAYWK